MDLSDLFVLAGLAAIFTAAMLRLAFAVGVYRHATALHHAGRPVWLVTPTLWSLAALLGGLLGVAVYWLVHEGSLRRLG